MALPRGATITDAAGGTVRGTLVLKTTPSLAPGQQVTFTTKAKFETTTQRLAWVGALTGSATKESTYRNNGAIGLIAIR